VTSFHSGVIFTVIVSIGICAAGKRKSIGKKNQRVTKGRLRVPDLNPPNPITKAEIDKFVAEDSDFGFEMSVLAELRTLGFECSHSGTYSDPMTKKIRQFDLRATIERADCKLALAVE
jgi:hypothetical protein